MKTDKKLVDLSEAELRTREFAHGKYLFPDIPNESKDGMRRKAVLIREQKKQEDASRLI